jgi:hypothetical protein
LHEAARQRRHLRAQRHQRVLVVPVKRMSCGLSTNSTPSSWPPQASGTASWLPGLGQPGQRDLALQPAAGQQAFAHRAAVGVFQRRVVDADGRAGARGHADHALTQRDLRARARAAVAAAGHVYRRSPAASSISSMAWRMPNSSHHAVEQGSTRPSRSVRVGHTRCAQRRSAGRRLGAAGSASGRAAPPLDPLDLVEVGAAQAEDAAHAGVRGDAGQLGLHALEQRALGLGAQVARGDAVHRAVPRVHHQQLGHRVGQHVAPRLVEELERQRQVPRVHVLDLRDVGDVGHAVGAQVAITPGMAPSRQGRMASRSSADGYATFASGFAGTMKRIHIEFGRLDEAIGDLHRATDERLNDPGRYGDAAAANPVNDVVSLVTQLLELWHALRVRRKLEGD